VRLEADAPVRHQAGLFWTDQRQRLNWETVVRSLQDRVDRIFRQEHPDGYRSSQGKVQARQTVKAWELPKAGPPQVTGGLRFGLWTEPAGEGLRVTRVEPGSPAESLAVESVSSLRQLEPGDVIDSINGQPVGDVNTYWSAVKGSPAEMRITFRDVRTGESLSAVVALNPPNSRSRFGVEAQPSGDGGMRISRVWPNYPGIRIHVSFPGNNRPISLSPGDVILSAADRPVFSPDQLAQIVRQAGREIPLTFRRAQSPDVYRASASLRDAMPREP
jgi:S1-C subfamily serine protease